MNIDTTRYEIHAAPLQGLTDNTFRTLHAKYYGGVDYYYTPFVRIERGDFRSRDLKDLEANTLPNLVPQIIPANADELKRMTETIAAKGFEDIDINMGCPFPPLMAHGQGAAMLNNPDKAAEILRALEEYKDITFSLKMRLGYADTHQWTDVIDSINAAKLHHVAVHARYAKQQYKGECDLEAFAQMAEACNHKVIYNGDIRSVDDAQKVISLCPQIGGVMIGRGLLADLSLALKLKGEEAKTKETFRRMHTEMVDMNETKLSGESQLLMRMKGYWEYLCANADKKALKAIKKATSMDKYRAAVSLI